jgi:hypothetical protein
VEHHAKATWDGCQTEMCNTDLLDIYCSFCNFLLHMQNSPYIMWDWIYGIWGTAISVLIRLSEVVHRHLYIFEILKIVYGFAFEGVFFFLESFSLLHFLVYLVYFWKLNIEYLFFNNSLSFDWLELEISCQCPSESTSFIFSCTHIAKNYKEER